ncbi:hypothetical protein C8Q70DRAFT_468063 [Cubamyces menziesii]|nr:hypothetical protein C8Q70DRAFT_468063 [Cubamyces menziesii]
MASQAPVYHDPIFGELSRILGLQVANAQMSFSEGVQHTILEAIEARQAKVDSLLGAISELRTLYNRTSPISILPPELLTVVFLYATSDGEGNADIISISRVCRHWRDSSLQTPALWTRILLDHPAGIEAFLERSRPLPAYIAFKTSYEPATATLRLIGTEAHRLRSLKIKILPMLGTRVKNIMNRVKFAAPMLEELVVENESALRRPNRDLETLPGPDEFSGVPSLRTLTLISAPLTYVPAGTNLLVNLKLHYTIPHPIVLFKLLQNSSQLETLSLRGSFDRTGEGIIHHVHLSNLKTLQIDTFPPAGIANILSNLMMPAVMLITIQVSMDITETFELAFPVGVPEPSFGLGCLGRLQRMVLFWSAPHGLNLRAYANADDDLCTPALSIQGINMVTEPGRRFLADWPFDASGIQAIDICGDYFIAMDCGEHTQVERHWWLEMLQGLPELKVLRVMAMDERDAFGMIEPLSRVTLSETLCPKLETLELFDIVPASKEFAMRVYDIVAHRGVCPSDETRVLKTVELFNAGDLKGVVDTMGLPNGCDVEILQE